MADSSPDKNPFLDRRQMALQYSETFKISSRAEASVVLKLTQRLSDNLEQYFLKCKGLEILPSIVCGNKDSYIHPGLESTLEKPVLKIEEPSSASCVSEYAISIDIPHKMLEIDSEEKPNQVIPFQYDNDLQSRNDPGSQSIKRRKIEEPDLIPFFSSSSVPHKYDEPDQPTQVEMSSQYPARSAPFYTDYTQSLTKPTPYFSDTCDYGPFSTEQNSEHCAFVSQTSSDSFTDVKTNSESKPSVSSVNEKRELSLFSMENKDIDLDVTSNTSTHETQAQGKTSKTLSPDILQLLKGKDASTVTNILKTLSPFYPALQAGWSRGPDLCTLGPWLDVMQDGHTWCPRPDTVPVCLLDTGWSPRLHLGCKS